MIDTLLACMATVLRNHVWVAPGQDQTVHSQTAPPPLAADRLRAAEEPGQVLFNTRDATTGTYFYEYNGVGC